MSILDGSTQFIPAHWLELACWNRPMIVYSRTIPDPQPTTNGRVSVPYRSKPETVTDRMVRRKSA